MSEQLMTASQDQFYSFQNTELATGSKRDLSD